jgi:hypothetical protein
MWGLQKAQEKSIRQLPHSESNLKCSYISPERYKYCSKSNLVCINSNRARDAGFQLPNQTLHTITIPSSPSVIGNLSELSELSEKELLYFNDMYKSTCSASHQNNFSIHSHIWSAYNEMNFPDKALVYSLLANHVKRLSISRSTSEYNEDYDYFKSRFRKSQWIAISKGEVSECHLIATFLAILSCRNEYPPNWLEVKIHHRGFLNILGLLVTYKAKRNFNSSMRLQHLYPYLLSYVRRMSVFWEDENSGVSSDYDMLQLSNRLLSCPIDLAENQGSATGLSAASSKEDGRPSWNWLLFRVYDDIRGLHGCVRVVASGRASTNKIDYPNLSILTDDIGGIRERSRSIRDLPSVTEVLRMVTRCPDYANLLLGP